MSKGKKWIIAAAALLGVGLLLCGAAYAALGFDFSRLATDNYVTNTYDVKEEFRNIRIEADTENVAFAPSDDGKCRVICLEDEKEPHRVRVEGDTLTVEKTKSRRWHIGFSTNSPAITVCLPEDAYEDLTVAVHTGDVEIPKDFGFENIRVTLTTGDADCFASAGGAIWIETDTGRIEASDLSAEKITLISGTGRIRISDVECKGDLDVREHTGKTALENVTCGNLFSTGTTGDLDLTNVVAADEFKLKRSTGDIRLDGCDAETVFAETSTGSVTGTLLSEKVFITQSDTGKVDVPKTITGGRCEITTGTGSIKIEIK